MTPNRYISLLILSAVLITGGILVATDSALTGRVLTRVEATHLADRTDEPGLAIHAIEGRGDHTRVSFIRADDPVPLAPLLIKRCDASRCLRELVTSLWARDVQREIADHILKTFDRCGLAPIAVPEIALRWGTNPRTQERPVGESLDLDATLLLDAAQIEGDIAGFETLARTCMKKLTQAPTDNPGWALITDDVAIVLRALPLAAGHVPPQERPVLHPGPYVGQRHDGSPVRKYGPTIEYRLAIENGRMTARPTSISVPPAMKENHIRVALKQPLLAWLAETRPDRGADGFTFRAGDAQAVDGSAHLGRIFVEVTDTQTSEPAVVAALVDLETLRAEGFELVSEFGFEPVIDVPSLHFDLEDLPDE
ncbi:hypothetical protein [uncultured Roseobacter sp.]|uniref:hypothetical protein n=1 Tax=uncultured Roseobacter sp. TaxID=114847 RepID=UPI002635D177|nr:hypothetical protein [uncultured Roseobacter sp.]